MRFASLAVLLLLAAGCMTPTPPQDIPVLAEPPHPVLTGVRYACPQATAAACSQTLTSTIMPITSLDVTYGGGTYYALFRRDAFGLDGNLTWTPEPYWPAALANQRDFLTSSTDLVHWSAPISLPQAVPAAAADHIGQTVAFPEIAALPSGNLLALLPAGRYGVWDNGNVGEHDNFTVAQSSDRGASWSAVAATFPEDSQGWPRLTVQPDGSYTIADNMNWFFENGTVRVFWADASDWAHPQMVLGWNRTADVPGQGEVCEQPSRAWRGPQTAVACIVRGTSQGVNGPVGAVLLVLDGTFRPLYTISFGNEYCFRTNLHPLENGTWIVASSMCHSPEVDQVSPSGNLLRRIVLSEAVDLPPDHALTITDMELDPWGGIELLAEGGITNPSHLQPADEANPWTDHVYHIVLDAGDLHVLSAQSLRQATRPQADEQAQFPWPSFARQRFVFDGDVGHVFWFDGVNIRTVAFAPQMR